MATLRAQEASAARTLEFLILTATRAGETIGARWDEMNLDNSVWTIPESRIKAAKEQRIPLSDPALAILRTQSQWRIGDFVFPGRRRGEPLSNMALSNLLARMGRRDITAHGFRSTFRDWTAEQTDFPREVAEMALAHAVGNAVEAAYRRGDLFEKRRKLMAAWAAYCDRVPSGKVVELSAVRAS